MKVGDLVRVRPHITSNHVLIAKSVVGFLVYRRDTGYHSIVLNSGVKITTAYANLEVISEGR